jgi:hypothetical protein
LRPSVVNRDDPRTPRRTRRREPRGDAAVGPGAPAYAWGRPLHREGRAPGLVLGRANGHLSSVRVDGVERGNHPAIPLVHVQAFARHADVKTATGYVHKIEDEKIRAAIAEALGG